MKALTIHDCPIVQYFDQTMKFGQLIKYNTGNFFLEKSLKDVAEKLIPNPFIRN